MPKTKRWLGSDEPPVGVPGWQVYCGEVAGEDVPAWSAGVAVWPSRTVLAGRAGAWVVAGGGLGRSRTVLAGRAGGWVVAGAAIAAGAIMPSAGAAPRTANAYRAF